jgi:hypothetical protein
MASFGFAGEPNGRIVEKRFLSSEERLFHTHPMRVEKNLLGNSPRTIDYREWTL